MRDEPPLPNANLGGGGHGHASGSGMGQGTSPNNVVGRNVGKGWIGMLGGGGAQGAIPSPASSGGLEDDHSQRL